MIRFFAEPQDIANGAIQLNTEDAEHIRALRLRPAERFIVCDSAGTDYICHLGVRGSNTAVIDETTLSLGEPSVMCKVYIALAKGDRLEYAVQKSVELGAGEILLFPSERCVSAPGDMSKKTARLQRIALETAKQCGRGRIPEVTAICSFESAIELATCAALPLFINEREEKRHLKQVLESNVNVQTVSIVTGPEGGFESHEAEFAQSSGMVSVTLGPRILRCETAPVAVLAALMFHTGNL